MLNGCVVHAKIQMGLSVITLIYIKLFKSLCIFCACVCMCDSVCL